MDIPKKYNPEDIEGKWYDYWMTQGYFHSEPNEKTPYTIVMPPPNVTGVLHMGHMLNNTIQDVLIRRARMKGYNACWVPGTDHASIATEAKVVAKLKDEGIEKSDLSRSEFLTHAWDWTHKHGGIILEQLKKLGASCDWNRTKFTMDDDLSASVQQTFIALYNKDLIYRGYRMVNWDPEAQTTVSDEEVVYTERTEFLYYLRYRIEGTESFVTVATTRPETIFGDTALCIHPDDERYTHVKGKKVVIPIVNRSIPVIEDDYVSMEFGTGCLKITPAHDPNDKEIGERHQLEVIDIFNDDGSLNAFGLDYQGKDRAVVRKEFTAALLENGLLEKTESYTHSIGLSERTGAVIEPKISVQWFLKMKALAKPALDAVHNGSIRFFPDKFINTYRHWMENVRDWNISRQLWWGHRIPAYFYGDGINEFVVAATAEEALDKAREKTKNKNLTTDDLKQSSDVLDTWFSSWLWPISVFDGIRHPENEAFKYYYPTNDLVTAPEILFFWVARMIVAGYEFTGEKPFENIYLTGIVRDKLGRKMSKSLGNSPDPISLINSYGADGVRVGMLLTSPAGNDLPFDEKLCVQGRNFANKIWNAFRLVKGWEVCEKTTQSQASKIAVEWFDAKFQKTLKEVEGHFRKYRISDGLMCTYKFVWDDFCSWYLEIIKPAFGQPIDKTTYDSTVAFFESCLKILHPFMPFITEELWQLFAERNAKEALIVAPWPQQKDFDKGLLKDFRHTAEVISGIRSIRKDKNIPLKNKTVLFVLDKTVVNRTMDALITKLGNLQLEYVDEKIDKAVSFRVKSNEYFIPVPEAFDPEEEIKKLTGELEYVQAFLKSVQNKLSNERFVNNAPERVVAVERQKEMDALEKITTLKERLDTLTP